MSLELFDSLMKMGTKLQKARQIRELQWEINSPLRCGDCFYWMKSSHCPREFNVNGYNRGPSCESIICGKFKVKDSTKAYKEKLKGKIKELEEVSE